MIVDYEPLPAVVDPEAALAPGRAAPVRRARLQPRRRPARPCRHRRRWPTPTSSCGARFENQRIAVVPMEGNATIAGRLPGRRRRRRPRADRVRLDADAAPRSRRLAPRCSASTRGGHAGHHAPRRRRVRRQGRHRRRAPWPSRRRPPARTAGEVGRDPVGEHGRDAPRPRPGAVHRDGVRPRRHITGMRCRIVGDAGAYAGFGGVPRHRTDADDGARASTASRRSPTTCAVALTNTTPMGAFRGAGRPEAAAFLERIMDIAADELGIDPVEIRRRNFLSPTSSRTRRSCGADVRQRRLRRRARRGACASPATTSCGAEQAERARARRPLAARHRRQRVRRGHRAAAAASEYGSVRSHDDGTSTVTRRHLGPRPGPRHVVRDDRRRPAAASRSSAIRFVQSDTAVVPARRRHRRLAFAAARRHRGAARAADAVLEQARAARRPPARGRPRRHRGDRRRPPRRGRRARAARSRGPSWPRGRDDDGEPLAAELDFDAGRRDVPVRRARRGRRGRPRDRRASTLVRHVAVDDCGRILNPLIVAGPAARRHRAGRRAGAVGAVRLRRGRQPAHRRRWPTTRMPSAAELPSFEADEHRDADAAQPARREGDRRVGHDRIDARGAERRRRRAAATSASATSTCPARPSGSGGRSTRRRPGARFAVARTAGVLRHPARAGRPAHARRRRCRHLTSTSRPAAAAASPARWSGPAGAGPGRRRMTRWRRCSRTPRATRSSSPSRGCASRPRRSSGRTWSSTWTARWRRTSACPAPSRWPTPSRSPERAPLAWPRSSPRRGRSSTTSSPARPPPSARGRGAEDVIATPSPPTCSRRRRPTPGSWASAGRPPPSAMPPRRRSTARRSSTSSAGASDGSPVVEKGWPPRYVARRIAWHALGPRVGDRGQERACVGPRAPGASGLAGAPQRGPTHCRAKRVGASRSAAEDGDEELSPRWR